VKATLIKNVLTPVDTVTEAEKYAHWVLDPANAICTGRLIKLAAKRFLSDLQRTDIYFDPVEAISMINFCEKNCNLWQGRWRGEPMHFEPWMRFIFEQVFGWFNMDETRRINKIFVQIAKKNAKTTLLAMLAIFRLFRDKRVQTPDIFVGANNEEQAKLCVNITGQIIEVSPRLAAFVEDERVKLFKYDGKIRGIAHLERKGSIKAMSKETGDKTSKTAGGKQGVFSSMGIIDEYGLAADANLLSAIQSSQAAAEEPLMAVITTAGFNLDGPCYTNTRRTGIEVLEGNGFDDGYLPFIYELDAPIKEDGKPEEITVSWLQEHPEVWQQCNPNLDVSTQKSFLRKELQEAKNEGGSRAVDVLTLNFNVWCGGSEIWVPKETWDGNTHGIKIEELQSVYECFAGIDIISGLSLNALILLFPNIRDNTHALLPFFWMPEGKVLPDKNDMRFDFSNFVKQGWIMTTPGNAIENEMIFKRIESELKKYRVHSGAFLNLLENHDILQGLMKTQTWNPISKGYQGQSTPTKAWEELLVNHRIEHFGNPVLSWMNSNCMVLRKDSEIMLQRSGGRIAGISASINALAQYLTIESTRDPQDAVIGSWK